MTCETCLEARKSGKDGIYCRLYGILMHRTHAGCRYHRRANNDDRGHRNNLDEAGTGRPAG